jgi:hypothetical protein
MRLFGLTCLLVSVTLVSGCGNVFFRASFNANQQTASGLVSVVQLTFVSDNNGQIQVTIVTLQNSFGASDFTFCGDQTGQFPVQNNGQAVFVSAQPCSNLKNVVIVIN